LKLTHASLGPFWQRLLDANAPFRVIDGDQIVSAPIEISDDMLCPA
jgi:hypothetical protein